MKNRFRRSIAMLLMLAMLSGLIGPGNLMLLTAYAEEENVETLDIPDIPEVPDVPEIVETPVEQGEIEIPPVDAGGDTTPPAEEQGGELPGQGAGDPPAPETEGETVEETPEENTGETEIEEIVGEETDEDGAQPVALTEGEFWVRPLNAEGAEIETMLLHLTGLFPEDAQVLAYVQGVTAVENAVEACRVVILSGGRLWQPAESPITVQIYSAAVSAILAEGLQPAVWEVRYPVEPVTEPLCLPYGEQAWVDEDGALCFEAWYFEVLEIAAVAAPAAEPTGEPADGLVPETNVTTDPVDDNTGEPVENPEENPVENPTEEPAGEIGGDSEDDADDVGDDSKELDETLTPDLNIRAVPLSGKLESTVSGVAATLTSAIGSTIAFNFEEQGQYVSISVTGTCQRNQEPVVRAASVNGDETRRVLEAWTVDNLKKKASLTLTTEVTALPELSEGECLAVCAVTGDTLGETLRSDLSVGDTVELPLAMKGPTGIAVVIAPAAPEDPDDETLIPDNAIWANDDLYLTGKMPKNAVVVAEPVSVEIEGQDVLAAWDIKIYANENQRQKGKTWQPAGDKVQVHMRSDAFQDMEDELNIYHLTDAKSAAELVGTVSADEDWVEFDAESFSTYAVSTVLEKTITATDGNTYKITVTYDPASGFPNGAELEVSEITDPDAYRTYLDNAAATLGVSLESLTYTRLFDITVIGPDGRSYQPNDAVSVKVELMESEARTVDDMRVVHFGSGAEELDAETANGTVTFETTGFSVFSFLDTSVIDRVVGAIFGTDSKLYENDDIILTGRMPLLGTVEAKPVTVELEGKNVLLAYDIKIYANTLMKLLGIAWQPSEGAITVQVKSDVLTAKSVDVYHLATAESEAELVREEVAVEEKSVSFEADSFSVYVIIDHEGNTSVTTPRVQFHFIDSNYTETSGPYTADPYTFVNKNGEYQTTQILTSGEGLEMIANPANKTDPERFFFGWYVVNGSGTDKITYTWTEEPDQIAFETPVTITPETGLQVGSEITWSIGNASGTAVLDGEGMAHVYLAPIYEGYYFVNFHLGPKESFGTDDDPGIAHSLMTRKLIILGSDGTAAVRIGNVQAESPDPVHKIFIGWETVKKNEDSVLVTDQEYLTLDEAGNEVNHPAGYNGHYIETTEEADIDLYPVFAEARWLYFNTGEAGNGATYVGARYKLTIDEVDSADLGEGYYFSTLPISQRNGYEFKGWYLSQDADGNGTGVCITDLTTLNASAKTIGLIKSYTTDGTTKLWEIQNGKLSFYKALDHLTLYARWEEVEDTTYSVLVWKQKVTDEVDAITQQAYDAQVKALKDAGRTDEEIAAAMADVKVKSYDYAAADSQLGVAAKSGKTLQNLIDEGRLNGFITTGSNQKYTGFSYSYTDMSTETVAGDKSTVINVYYDRDVHTFTFQVQDYTYTASTNNSANYGYVEGLGYVLLTRNGNTWTYSTGEYVYTQSSSTSSDNYYIPNSSGGYEQVYLYRYNNRWYRTRNWGWSGYTYSNEYTGNVYTRTEITDYYTGTRYIRSNYQSWQTAYTITALYGQNIVEHFNNPPFSTIYDGYVWSDVNGVLYNVVLSAASLEVMREADVLFQGTASGTTKHMYYYLEILDGDPASDTATNTRTFNGKSFYYYKSIAHKYPYVTLAEDFTPIEGFTNDPAWAEPQLQYGRTPDGQYDYYRTVSGDNYFYYTRNQYSLTFNVNYPNLAGLEWPDGQSENLTVSSIPYQLSLAAYGKTGDRWYFGVGDAENLLYGPAHYNFEGWYEDPEGTVPFNFNSTMPAGDKIVYAKWTPVSFRVHINPNGAVIDHSDHSAWDGGTQHFTDKATYINASYGTPITEYSVARNYVPISDTVAEGMDPDDVYYYVYTPYMDNAGEWGLHPDLRNAVYVKESQLEAYYNYYESVSEANIGYYPVDVLGINAWKNAYVSTQKYRQMYANEHYVFLGWFKDDESMPYNFSDPVTGSFTLTAHWRLDGGYYVQYIPEYRTPDGVLINGDMDQWRDPILGATYADQAETHTLQQPTGLSANGSTIQDDSYIFLGWRVVSVSETSDGNGNITNVTYTPLEKDSQGNVIYHLEGEPFTIEAKYADSTGRICMQAVYEAKDNSVRRPEIANLTLDANTGFITEDGNSELSESKNLGQLSKVGTVLLDVDDGNEQIVFGDIQSNIAVHLKNYAEEPNYFKHPDGHFLLGFDDEPDEGDFIATYATDAVISVHRTDNETIYAVWEPMVYITFVNNTGVGPVTFGLSSDDSGALQIVNIKNSQYERIPLADLGSVTVADGESITFAVPLGAEKNLVASGTNTLGTGKILVWNTSINVDGSTYDTADGTTTSYSHTAGGTSHSHILAKGETDNTETFTIPETLIVNENALTVTFTALEHDRTLVLHDNYREVTQEKYFANPLTTDSFDLPTPSTRIAYEFVGWDNERLPDGTTQTPDYPVGTPIANVFAFFGSEQIKTLYAVWRPKLARGETRVYKIVPEPGDQTKEFTFTVSITGRYKIDNNGQEDFINPQSRDFTLKDGQYLLVTTSKDVGVAGQTNNRPFIQAEVKKFESDSATDPIETTVLKWQRTTNVSGTVTFDGYAFINVAESDYSGSYYTTGMEKTAETNPGILTVAETDRRVTWTNTDAGGTVIYTNTRQTADVTVTKTLVGESAGTFRYTGSYTVDGKTTQLDEFTVNAGGSSTLPKIPVGAELTITEAEDNRYTVETALANGSTDANSADNTVTFIVPAEGETASFTNTLKSYPVKIVKVDQNGNGGVEARFNLTQGATPLVSGKYTTPTDNVIYDGTLYVGDYSLAETWVQDGYIGLSAPVTLSLSGSGALTSDNVHAVVSGSADSGFIVTVYNQATVDVTLVKQLIDPLKTREFSFLVEYSSTLNGETVTDSREVTIGGGESSKISIPAGATLTVTEKDTFNAYQEYDTTAVMMDVDDTDSDEHVFKAVIAKAGTLTFTNKRKTVDITVKKIVEGGDDAQSKSFNFTAGLFNGATPITGYKLADDLTTGSDGKTIFSLQHNGTRALTVPVGAKLTVQEGNEYSEYTVTAEANITDADEVTVDGANRLVTVNPAKQNLTITFTNSAILVAPTGVHFEQGPFLVLLGFGLLVMGLLMMPKLLLKMAAEADEGPGPAHKSLSIIDGLLDRRNDTIQKKIRNSTSGKPKHEGAPKDGKCPDGPGSGEVR